VDRPPEDPSPDDPLAPDQPPDPVTPDQPTTPYGPRPGEPSAAPPPGPPASPYTPPPIPPGPLSAVPAPYGVPPPDSPAPPPGSYDVWPPDEPSATPRSARPGVGAGVATGCGLQVLAVILFFATSALMFNFLGALWPFILVTVGSALLMLSPRWRRFATGALIVCAATWIIAIGPCIALLGGFGSL
jgi:hypothetical protein